MRWKKHSSFLTPTTVWEWLLLQPKICGQIDSPPFEKRRVSPISAYNVSTLRSTEKIQSSWIGGQPRVFQRAIDEVRTLPLTPQRVAQKVNLSFLWIKINLNRINSATKFLCVKTSSGKVVVELFHYLMCIDVRGKRNSSTKYLALKWPTPFNKGQFRRIFA